jgi:hypothetical protein
MAQQNPAGRPAVAWASAARLAALAVLYTALNAGKPLLIDDAAYETFARHIAEQPLNPYGFAAFWYDWPQPANEVLAPPVLLYWWALVRRLFGEEPWVWKAGLLPWAGLLVCGVYGLFRRFARGVEELFTWVLVLSPALLPSFNLMLDVPALALALTGVLVFLRAADRGSLAGAAAAGLLAGLAMQTKYTGALAPAAMLLYAVLAGRWRLGLAAGLVAAQVFLSWELLTSLLYGRSHFLLALADGGPWVENLGVAPFLSSHLGGVFPAVVLLALAALGVRRSGLLLAAGVVLGGYAVVALVGWTFFVRDFSARLFDRESVGPVEVQPAEVIFHLYSLAGAVALILVVRRLLLLGGRAARRDTLFLLLWLGLEVLGYLAMTPFPAVRRVLGVLVVLTLLTARLAARTCRTEERRRTLRAVAAGGIGLGLAFFALDWYGARIHQRAAEGSAAWVRARGGGTAWFVGHWGFQFYAERAGLRPVVPAAPGGPAAYVPLPSPSRLRADDWLIVPDRPLEQQGVWLDPERLEAVGCLHFGGAIPVATVPCFYGGRTAVEHRQRPGLGVRIFRVRAGFTPVAEP